MSQLIGKVAVVVGGGRGLGRAIALAFAEAGADLAIASRTRKQLDEVAEEIRARNRRALPIETNVSESASVTRMAEAVRKEFGRIDILVNSAGIGWMSRVVDTTDDAWKLVIDTNLTGTFYCCREVGRIMIEQKAGSIINMASVAGVKGPPGLCAYAASKGGVISLTRVLALEAARFNVRVNAIAPGYFRTDMNALVLDDPEMGPKILKRIPMRRVGQPEELSPLAVYLASDQASYVTGEVYFISGGEMAQ